MIHKVFPLREIKNQSISDVKIVVPKNLKRSTDSKNSLICYIAFQTK